MSDTVTQHFPVAVSVIANPGGTVSDTWYRFFRTLWNQVSAGTTSDITLGGTNDMANSAQTTANQALTTANAASAAVVTERNRATAAEANLQAQITANTNSINTLNGQVTSLQNQINTINQRLANAGIP